MDPSSNDLCEKIVNEIAAIFHKNPNLSTFEVIPVQTNQNKSPVVQVDNNLGLESWCIKHVYDYAHQLVLDFKLATNNYSKVIWHNHDIVKYLNVATLLNPDVGLFWNIRRYLFGHNKLNITFEFQFSSMVLSKKPKSNEAFAYRRWLFLFLSGESIDFTFEISLCDRCADRNTSNYHAWAHRLWVLDQKPDLLQFEMQLTEKFIRRHISDFSCFHHRATVLRKMWQQRFYEPATPMGAGYADLRDLIAIYLPTTSSQSPPLNELHLLVILLPRQYHSKGSDDERGRWSRSRDVSSFLYCFNLAAYDLQMVADLTETFGEREAFHCHRRSILQFIYATCKDMEGQAKQILVPRGDSATMSPVSKLIKLSHNGQRNGDVWEDESVRGTCDNESSESRHTLLYKLFETEAQRSDRHRQWCSTFLDFHPGATDS